MTRLSIEQSTHIVVFIKSRQPFHLANGSDGYLRRKDDRIGVGAADCPNIRQGKRAPREILAANGLSLAILMNSLQFRGNFKNTPEDSPLTTERRSPVTVAHSV